MIAVQGMNTAKFEVRTPGTAVISVRKEFWRWARESNPLMAVLQTAAFPLRHVAVTGPDPATGSRSTKERVKGLEPSASTLRT